MHDAGGVVGDAYLGGCDGEGGVVGTHNHVARQAEVAGTAPYRSTDAGNDGNWGILHSTQQLLHRHIVCQRVFTVLRQFTDVVSGAPHTFAALGFDNDADAFLVIAVLDSGNQFVAHLFAQAVEVLRVLHLDIADAVVDNGIGQHVK